MKFHKAIKLLRNGKAKTISNPEIGAIAQTLESIQFWFCEQKGKDARINEFQKFMFSDKWQVGEYE